MYLKNGVKASASAVRAYNFLLGYIKSITSLTPALLIASCALHSVYIPPESSVLRPHTSLRLDARPDVTAISPDKRLLVVGNWVDYSLVFIDISQRHLFSREEAAAPVSLDDYKYWKADLKFMPIRLFFDATGKYLYVIGYAPPEKPKRIMEAKIAKLDAWTGIIKNVRPFEIAIFARGVVLAPDNSVAFIANLNDVSLLVVDLDTLEIKRKLLPPYGRAAALSLSSDGKLIFAAHPVHGVVTTTFIQPEESHTKEGQGRSITTGGIPVSLVIDEDGRRIFVLDGLDYSLTIIDLDNYKRTGVVNSLTGEATIVKLSVTWGGLEPFIATFVSKLGANIWISRLKRELIVWAALKSYLSIFDLPSLKLVEKLDLPSGVNSVLVSEDFELFVLVRPKNKLVTILSRKFGANWN